MSGDRFPYGMGEFVVAGIAALVALVAFCVRCDHLESNCRRAGSTLGCDVTYDCSDGGP